MQWGGKLYDEQSFAKRKMAKIGDFVFSFKELLLSSPAEQRQMMPTEDVKLRTSNQPFY